LLFKDSEFANKELKENKEQVKKEKRDDIRCFLRVWRGDHREFSSRDHCSWRKKLGFFSG